MGSYPTFSPLPSAGFGFRDTKCESRGGRFVFCGTVRQGALRLRCPRVSGRQAAGYAASRPVVFGLSSPGSRRERSSAPPKSPALYAAPARFTSPGAKTRRIAHCLRERRSAGFQPASDGAKILSDSEPVGNRRSFCGAVCGCVQADWKWPTHFFRSEDMSAGLSAAASVGVVTRGSSLIGGRCGWGFAHTRASAVMRTLQPPLPDWSTFV